MKTTGIISAFIFAHAAFAQATDSSSIAVSSATGSASVPVSTSAGSATGSASSASVVAASTGVSSSGSASASASASGTKTGTKSASSAAGSSAAAATTSSVDAGSSGGSPTSIPLAATSAVSSSSGNPLIPDTAGSTCTDFLNKLNADTAVSSCFTPILNAVSAFSTSGSSSASALTKALNNLCASNACSASTLRAKLTEFKDSCGDELTSSASDSTVISMYDILYALFPYKAAVCAKDQDTQAYCIFNIGTGSSVANTTQNLATGPSESVKYAEDHLANSLVSSRRRAQSVLVPNTDTYRNTNLMYLFTSPDMNSGELCTSCTQQIISKYVAWESATPHALGLANSPLLGGQSELWTAIQQKCPTTFLSEVSNIAGVASADQISGAAPALTGGMATALFGALAAFALI